MKKRILSIVLSIVMLVSLLPTTALAFDSGVYVGGVSLGDGTEPTYYKNGDTTGNLTGTPTDYNAKLETVDGDLTLTINNLLVAGTAAAGIESHEPLNLVLEGANSVTGGDNSYGIYAHAALNISGDGALSVTGGAVSGTFAYSYGIYTAGALTITGGTISATGGDADGANAYSYGIFSENGVIIEGGTINATAGTAISDETSAYSCGIEAGNNGVTITGGVVVATGGTADKSFGIYTIGDPANGSIVKVYGGVVVARAGSAGTVANAIGEGVLDMTDGFNSTKVAGGAIDSTAVVIVPNTWTQTELPEVVNGTITLTGDTYIVNQEMYTLELSGGTTIDTSDYTLLSVSLYSDSFFSYGIYTGGNLNIKGAGSVIAVSGAGKSNYGLYAKEMIAVSGAANVTAIGTVSAEFSRGIYNSSSGGVTASDSARVTAIGGLSTAKSSHGIYYGFVTVEDDAEVTAVAGKAGFESFGIDLGVTVSGGTLNAIGGVAGSLSCGIYANEKTVTIAPGTTVNGVGGKYGLCSANGICEISAGSYAGGTAAINCGGGVTNLLAPGYCYYIGSEVQQPDGNTVGGAYQTVTIGKAPPCTVTFVAGEGTLNGDASKEVQPGEVYGTLPTATTTVEGESFGGWWTKDGTDGDWGEQVKQDSIVAAVSNHTLYARYGHGHPICGAVCTHNGAHESVLWTEWSDPNALPNEAGYYYLTGDVTYNNVWQVPADITTDLNGHTLTGDVAVSANEAFTLTDCVGTGVLAGEVDVGQYAAFNLYGGTVSCNSDCSSVVSLRSNATFNQYGGTVKNENTDACSVKGAWNGDVYNYYGGTVTALQYGIFYVKTVNLYATPDISGGTADFASVSKIVLHTALTEPREPYTVSVPKRASFTEGWTAYMGEKAEDYYNYFTGDAGLFTTKVDGELQFAVLEILEQPTAGNGYTVTVNDPNAAYQWYEWATKDFAVVGYNETAGENELAATVQGSVSYDSGTGKWTLGSNIDGGAFIEASFKAGDIVTVTFDESCGVTLSGGYFTWVKNEDNTVWTSTKIGTAIIFREFTGGETFTVTVTRGVLSEALNGRIGVSLLTKVGSADAIMGGKSYVCVVNDYLTSESVEYEHTHNWAFSYAPDVAGYGKITATCRNAGCDVNGGTAECNVIIATDVKYSSDNYACPVSIGKLDAGSDWDNAGLNKPEVTDEGLTEGLNGTATITVHVNGEDVGVENGIVPYTLNKGTLTERNFNKEWPRDAGYDGDEKELVVYTNISGNKVGAVTVVYYDESGNPVNGKPVNIGTYTVKINVEESAYYEAVNGLEVGTLEIKRRDIEDYVDVDPIPDQYFTGNGVQPKPVITAHGDTLVENTDYTLSYGENKAVGTGTVTITGIGNYTGEVTLEFNIVYNTSVSAADVFADYDENKWFNANNAPTFTTQSGWFVSETAPVGDGTSVSYDGEGAGVTKTVYAKDSDGKVYQVTIKYNYDSIQPAVTAGEVDDTWSNVSKDIRVTATDDISGVASVEISDGFGALQDVEPKDGAYYCTVTENGGYTVKVTDKAGNIGYGTVNVTHIDNMGPWFMIYGYNYDGGWHTTVPTVTVEALPDNGSGIPAEGAYSFDGGATWQDVGTKEYGDGEHYVAICVKDNAGNITVHSNPFTLKVDTVAPGDVTVSATVGGEAYASGDTGTIGDVVMTLTGGGDATSGFDKFQYSTDGGETWNDVTGSTFTHTESTDGNGVTYLFRAVDVAGNVGAEKVFVVMKAFTVRFNANGGSGEMGSDSAYVGGALVMPECTFTREGYTFTGWNTAADGSGTAYAVDDTMTDIRENEGGGFDLYAQWTVNEYAISYEGMDGAEYGANKPVKHVYDSATAVSDPVKVGYTFTGWQVNGDEAQKDLTLSATGYTADIILTATWTANTYTVKFDANGGTDTMADQSFTYDEAAKALTANAFTREGYKFVGWAESADATGVDYVDKQVVSNLTAAPNGVVTLYAVWTRDIILSGDIVAPSVTNVENLEVVLVGLNGTEYPVFVTGDSSPYHYTVTVPEGEYQLIIKDTQNNVTVTAKEELNEDKAEEPITMPTGNKSSIVDSENAGEYAPIVGGLDAIAESTEGTNVTVTLTMTHEPANEDDAEHDALMDAAGSQKSKLTFFEIDLVKNVDGTETPITETTDPIEIVIPFDTTRKQNFKVYRFHDYNGNSAVDEGEIDILTTTANADGEYIEVGTGSVTIHAKFFSLYAIGYTEPAPYYPPVVSVHVCTSKCDVCGGCEDAACTENACKDKCRLFGMNFTDVAEGKWYTEAVEYVYHHKMMEGVGNNLFDINGTTTRAMIVTILWRLEGEPVVNYLMQFEDIPTDTWYTEAVRWAASEKIVEGYSDTAFGPADDITREQFATILWRYAKHKGYDVSVGEDTNILSYEDAFSISEWAIPAMQWACGAGLMQGDGVNLTPKADATRAQAAALFQRFCENVAEK